MNKNNLPQKTENGTTLYFYSGLGWVTEDRFNQPDVLRFEEIRRFDFNPDNSHCCDECPHNEGCSSWGGNLPCGQQNCWVDVSCRREDD